MEVLETSKSRRTKLAAAKTLAILDGVNVRRESNEIAAKKAPASVTITNVNNNSRQDWPEDEAWYGNDMWDRIAAKGGTPPASDTPLPGPVQGDSVRPPLGQNGHGPANGHAGPRPKA